MLTIKIDTDNSAFQPDPRPELARILADLSEKMASGFIAVPTDRMGHIRDSNGNRVGVLELKHGARK